MDMCSVVMDYYKQIDKSRVLWIRDPVCARSICNF